MKTLFMLIAAVVLVLAVALFAPTNTRPQPASAAPEAFSHEDCQYPYRWSNPVDGCDNSDPAVPECIKGAITEEAERTCIAEFVREYEAQGQEQVNTPPQTSTPPVNACGGTK